MGIKDDAVSVRVIACNNITPLTTKRLLNTLDSNKKIKKGEVWNEYCKIVELNSGLSIEYGYFKLVAKKIEGRE